MAEVRVRQGWFSSLQRLEAKVNRLDPSSITAGEVKANLENAEAIWKKLEDAHAKILANVQDDAGFLLQQEALEPMSDLFFAIKSKLYTFQLSRQTGGTNHPAVLKLPDMQLPTFDGKYADWPAFKDLFSATVDRHSSLTGAQKLQYLKSCTKGEAASLIKSFIVTDDNYMEAWSLLEQQYNNPREIITSLVKKVLFQPSIKQESASALQEMLNTTMESIRSLKVLGRPTEQWDDIIVVLLTEKFDSQTKSEWARSLKGTDQPTLTEVQNFIIQHIRTLHARGYIRPVSQAQSTTGSSRPQQQFPPKRISSHHTSVNSCSYCKGAHKVYQCQQLHEMSTENRVTAIKNTSACINCLREGHSVQECSSPSVCRRCNKKHNTFLHIDNQSTSISGSGQDSSQSSDASTNETTTSIGINNTAFSAHTSTLLKTALVDVVDNYNVKHQLRVCLDDGGEGGLINEKLVHRLGLPKEKSSVIVSGVGGVEAMRAKWRSSVRLFSKVNSSFIDVSLYAVPKVTSVVNNLPLGNKYQWSHLAGLNLADPDFHKGGEVDILLGADVVPYLLKDGLVKADNHSPVAQNTMFGWVVFGKAAVLPPIEKSIQSGITCNNFKCEISQALQKFWEVEDFPNQPSFSAEERECENHFVTTHQRDPNGKYTVRLPFNSKKATLGESRVQAYRRLLSLERRFKQHPEYKQAYVKFMREYLELGHMSLVSSSQNKAVMAYYLPHHFVLKEDSTTTKQRTVFDGSARTSSGASLNDTLLVGPTIQPDLYTLILNFRYYEIALKADVEKMYRQFSVHQDDRDFQRILWREDSSEQVLEYQLNTVTYGTTSAPFLATRCLNQLAQDEASTYPLASETVLKSFHIDDCLKSSETITQAKEIVSQLINHIQKGGMQIRKWCSNSLEIMNTIPENLREEGSETVFDNANDTSFKALGNKWKPATDEFLLNVTVDKQSKPTKRHLLSEISKTFDPLGWLAPVTIRAKLLLQKIWLAGNDWDEEVSSHLQEEWSLYQDDIIILEQIRIPRCIMREAPSSVELHGFSDSSEMAYAAVLYLKCVYNTGNVSVHLMTCKSRVSPIKCVSLPMLELCGAALLAELITQVGTTVPVSYQVFCWTDSTIVLRWITSHSRKWKTFVSNRVSSIQQAVAPEHWRHVKGEDNPADLPSRGIPAQQLMLSSLWWNGPSWLQDSVYPEFNKVTDEVEVQREERSKQLLCHSSALVIPHDRLFNAYSTLSTLVRKTATLIKFIEAVRGKLQFKTPASFTTQELHQARLKLIKWAQSQSFREDILALTPAHFLIGGPLIGVPEPNVSTVKQNRLSYWESVRQMTQHFWKRWSIVYLSSLQQRHKWTKKRENVQTGDLVVVAEDNLAVTKWMLGRIITVHPGQDGLVRSATVKTLAGEIRRPITKLSPLLSNISNDQ